MTTHISDEIHDTMSEVSLDRRALLGGGLTLGLLTATNEEAAAQAAATTASGPGRLTCHVLDTYTGKPGEGMKVELFTRDGQGWKVVKSVMTTATGRTQEPLFAGDGMMTGDFMLEFSHADFFRQRAFLPNPPFYDKVVHFFSIPTKDTKYHITMVASPWGYSTFRWKE